MGSQHLHDVGVIEPGQRPGLALRRTAFYRRWVMVAGSLFIALLTISFQALKAAISNPVDSLRIE